MLNLPNLFLDRGRFLLGIMKYYLSAGNTQYTIDHDLVKYLIIKLFLTGRLAGILVRGSDDTISTNPIAFTNDSLRNSLGSVDNRLRISYIPGDYDIVLSQLIAILQHNHYSHHGINVTHNDVVIDGGANIGIFSLIAAQIYGANRVYAFEPEPRNFSYLKTNTSCYENIFPIHAGLWNDKQEADIHINSKNTMAHSLVDQTGDRKTRVQLLDLDTFVNDNRLDRLDFIKLDIEGAEPSALLGAKEVLAHFKPKLAVSAYHHFHHLFEIADIIKRVNPRYSLSVCMRQHQQMIFAE